MTIATSPTRLAEIAGISVSYASQLLSGVRTPSRSLALVIFGRTGIKFGPLAGLSDDDAATIARIEGVEIAAQDHTAADTADAAAPSSGKHGENSAEQVAA